ncbi:hypothetical protein GCM10010462_26680 [Microbacterium dextranolyticum]|uniref:DUF2029 domain-containing protein n=1 Tax=Microbacterium dextranolyticum TaxID=36806 RepID=A0A9W6HP90_9MICO|nr:hypothetical protein GCM10017591_25400 [Microbacterium dextranolyticum]
MHIGVAWLGFALPNEPMGDIYHVYEPWSLHALTGAGIVGITEPWVYPQLALVPMILAHGFDPIAGYIVGWAIVAALVDAAAFAVLVGRASSRPRVIAGGFWLAFIAALGPVGLYRLEAVTVALSIIGCLWIVGRPWAASLLLAAATWIKVWPAALLAAAVIAARRRAALIGGAVALTALTLGGVTLAGGGTYAFGFVGEQTTRGLQIESPVATPYVWGTVLHVPGFQVYYSPELLTYQVDGPQIGLVVAAMTPLLLTVMAALVAVGIVHVRRGVRFVSLFPPLSLALVLGFIVCNKVGSPQYLAWLVPSLVTGLVIARRRWAAPALLSLVAAVLTQLVYPVFYDGILSPAVGPVTILTLRNLVLIALFVWMVVRVIRLPAPLRATTPAVAAP